MRELNHCEIKTVTGGISINVITVGLIPGLCIVSGMYQLDLYSTIALVAPLNAVIYTYRGYNAMPSAQGAVIGAIYGAAVGAGITMIGYNPSLYNPADQTKNKTAEI